jgi:hypothetical protein
MDPLQFNPMMNQSKDYLVRLDGKENLYDLFWDEKAQRRPHKPSTGWRIHLARYLSAWARRLDPGSQPSVSS